MKIRKIINSVLCLATISLLSIICSSVNAEELDFGLKLAAYNNDVLEIDSLINQGVNINGKSDEGMTALIYAVGNNSYDAVKVLLENGAYVNAKTNNAMTALMYAVGHNHANITKLLLEYGADVKAKSADGLTAEAIAKAKGFQEMLSLLNKSYKVKPAKTASKPANAATPIKPAEPIVTVEKTQPKNDNEELKNKYLNTADELYKQGQYEEAVLEWNRVLEIEPGNTIVQQKINDAKYQINTIKNKELSKKYISDGDNLYAQGKYDEAIKKWEKVLEIDVNNDEVIQKIEDAKQKFEQVKLEKQKKDDLNSAEQLFKLNKYGDALKVYEGVLIIDPENKTAQERIKIIKQKIELTNKKVVQSTVTATTETPAKTAGKPTTKTVNTDLLKRQHFAKGTELAKQNKYNEAIKEWEEVLKIDPNHVLSQKKIEDAKLKIRPVSTVVPESKTDTKPETKSISKSTVTTENVSAKPAEKPDNKNKMIKSYLDTAEKLFKQNKFEDAIKQYEDVLKIDPVNKTAQDKIKLAQQKIESTNKKVNKSTATVTSEVPAKPVTKPDKTENKPPAKTPDPELLKKQHFAKGTELSKQGKYEDAIKEWEEVLKIDPNHVISRKKIEDVKSKIKPATEVKAAETKTETKQENKPVAKSTAAVESVPAKPAAKSDKTEVKPTAKTPDPELLKKQHFAKGTELAKQNKYDEAIKEWEEVLKIDPNHSLTKQKIEAAKQKLGKK